MHSQFTRLTEKVWYFNNDHISSYEYKKLITKHEDKNRENK